jgi:hypothetical protein
MADFGTILNNQNNSLNLYCNNTVLDGVDVKNTLATLQTEIDSLTPNPNAWNNGNGQTTTNQQILFTDNSINGAITSDKLYFDTANNFIMLNEEIMPVRSEINFIQDEINTIDGQISGINSSILSLSQRADSLETYANPAMLRAMNCNNWTPSTVYNIIWSNLTAQEQLEWKGLDPLTIDPVQSATGNYWNFTKAAVNTTKIGWYIPVDLSGLTFQDLESFWCVIRFNTTTNISTEGSLYFQITTNPPTAPNYFRTRINYSNPATPMNQTGYFYKIYALDTITTTTTANLGRGQEVGQQKFKLNPMNVRSDLWSIPFNKLVSSPTGDTTAGYTTAPIQSISLQTASNINTFNFDVISIGYLDKQYNLFYS